MAADRSRHAYSIKSRAPTPQDVAFWLRAQFTEGEALDVLRLAANYTGTWDPYFDEVGLWLLCPDVMTWRAHDEAGRV